jgi:hypothetical protein
MKLLLLNPMKTVLQLCTVLIFGFSPALANVLLITESEGEPVDMDQLLGTNMALWYEPEYLETGEFEAFLQQWSPGLVRLPGGSWSNEYYWNGNGVRQPDGTFNMDAFKDGSWEVDYSDYAPGFRIHGTEQHLSDYHGVIDVLTQHRMAESLGADQMVTVNLGTGTITMAVEWLKWAGENKFSVPYWEIGNELNGQWETGHFLEDGSGMTGEVYARRFVEYAAALKSIHPSIKVGGPASSDLSLAFVEELIRDAGDQLDFITFHAYPVGVQRDETDGKFQDTKQLRKAISDIRQWLTAYQPDRADLIEVGITEWNMKVNEDRDTADLINGLWSAAWIGAMLEGGVTFANQWDLLTMTKEGGHGAFHVDGDRLVPKSIFWAHYLWGKLMGDRLVGHCFTGEDHLETFVTMNDSAWQVMLINRSDECPENISIQLPDTRKPGPVGRVATYSHREYFWDPFQHKPLWSRPPSVESLSLGERTDITVPAFSIVIVEIPFAGNEPLAQVTPAPLGDASLKLIIPERSPSDLPLEVWIYAWDEENNAPYAGELAPAQIELEGPVDTQRLSVSLSRSVGRFVVQPMGPGNLLIQGHSGDLTVNGQLVLKEIAARPVINWTFDNPIEEWGATGTFAIGMEPSVKPNEFVAEAIMENALPGDNADVLMLLEQLPQDLSKERIGGVVGEMQASPDFATDDPNARVNIVLQSEADHWMVVGSIPLESMRGEWEHFKFEVDDPRRLKAMARLYAVRYQIESEAPVTGRIYFDNLGFLLRAAN